MSKNNFFSDEELLSIQTANHQKIKQETDSVQKHAEYVVQFRKIMHFTFMSFLQAAKEYPSIAAKCGVAPKTRKLRRYHFWDPGDSQPLYDLKLGSTTAQYYYRGEFGPEKCSAEIYITEHGKFVIIALGRIRRFNTHPFENDIDSYHVNEGLVRGSVFCSSLQELCREAGARFLNEDEIITNIKKHFQRLLTL